LAWPEDGVFGFEDLAWGARAASVPAEGPRPSAARLRVARAELRWFYGETRAYGFDVCDAPEDVAAAVARIGKWLLALEPRDRGAFTMRYDGRRWPVRLTREFGGLTSVVVAFATMMRGQGARETLADAQDAAAKELFAAIGASVTDPARKKHLRRLRRAAKGYVLRAELAYLEARGDAPSAVPSSPREDA
jgi:hypothetical protein